jgi:hypothetical protein
VPIYKKFTFLNLLIYDIYYISHLTGIIDINSDKSSEMLPLEHELQSGVSTFLKTNRTRCIELCSSQNSCSVASFNSSYDKLNGSDNEHHEPPEQIGNCYHYMYSPLGLWKIKTITDDVHWFAKIRNIGMLTFLNIFFCW